MLSRVNTNANGNWKRRAVDELKQTSASPGQGLRRGEAAVTQATAGPIYKCLGPSKTVILGG